MLADRAMEDPAADWERRALRRAERHRVLSASALGRLQCDLSSLRSLLQLTLPLDLALQLQFLQDAK